MKKYYYLLVITLLSFGQAFAISPITGSTAVCQGQSVTLSDATIGGTWSVADISVATVGSTGIVTGVFSGTTTISYTVGTSFVTFFFRVNPTPAPIYGYTVSCVGLTVTMSDTYAGGTWASSETTIATIGSATGFINALSAGMTTITYTLPTGCYNTTGFDALLTPDTITGASTVCVGSSAALSDVTSGGTWGSSNTLVADITIGTLVGVSPGTTTISYTLATGCYATRTEKVSPDETGILGTFSLCTGETTALIVGVFGGTWSTSATAIGSIGSSSGILTGVAAGIATVTYTISVGCLGTHVFTVMPSPGIIGGPGSICVGSNIDLTEGSFGGTWSSSNISVGTVSTAGIAGGLTVGTVIITYQLSSGCIATKEETVVPAPAPIIGMAALCAGSHLTLSDTTTGGTWSSTDTLVSTIGTTGTFNGVASGTSTISYTISDGCAATATAEVLSAPVPISGPDTFCAGSSYTYADSVAGGVWTSSNVAVAAIGSATGALDASAAGTSIITYALATGCLVISNAIVLPAPTAIFGPATVCDGSAITLTDATTGGTWSSSTTSVTISGTTTGFCSVTGTSIGTGIISYTLPGGCATAFVDTVLPLPITPTGPLTICEGSTSTFTDGVSGGTWTSSRTLVAAIGSASGILDAIAPGTDTIVYRSYGACYAAAYITVLPMPAAISGVTTFCSGYSTLLTDTTAGGTWSSSTTTVGTVSSSGVLSGISAGTTLVSYTLVGMCVATTLATVLTSPAPIGLTATLCEGATYTCTDVVGGGTWASSNTVVATVGSATGLLAGIGTGTVMITYKLGGCFSTVVSSIVAAPSAISGITALCEGLSATLIDAMGGGVWVSGNGAVVSIGSGTGLITGIAGGTAIISYLLPDGCGVSRESTVYGVAQITGIGILCEGATTRLTDSLTGGTWVSGNTPVAAIVSTYADFVTISGFSAGTAIISYTNPGGCTVLDTLLVNTTPTAITGTDTVCPSVGDTLYDGTSGGFWISATPSVLIGSTTGIIQGATTYTGSDTIVYATLEGCFASYVVYFDVICDAGVAVHNVNTLGLSIFPNPSQARFTINANQYIYTHYNIIDGMGRQVTQGDINAAKTLVDVRAWAPGAYFVVCTGNEGNVALKFLKE